MTADATVSNSVSFSSIDSVGDSPGRAAHDEAFVALLDEPLREADRRIDVQVTLRVERA